MSSPNLGAHGRPASFSGSNGSFKPSPSRSCNCEGGPSEMPSESRSGETQPDESVREYTGNPHDAAGSYGQRADLNRVPKPNHTRSGST